MLPSQRTALTLKGKTQIVVALALVLAMATVYVCSQVIFSRSFAGVERQETRDQVSRVRKALDLELVELEADAADYAVWDDSVAFVQREGQTYEEYVSSNLVDSFYRAFQLNFAVFLDAQGRVVYSSGFDLGAGHAVPPPTGLLQVLKPGAALLQHPGADSVKSGLVMLSTGPVLLASNPIVTSDGKGPIFGTLVIGRLLDSAYVRALSEQTLLPVSVASVKDSALAEDSRRALSLIDAGQSVAVQAVSESRVAGYSVVDDIFGQPALLLRVETPRAAYQQGQAGTRWFMLALAAIALGIGLAASRLLETRVFSRLSRLVADIRERSGVGHDPVQVTVQGHDEVSLLAETINRAFSELVERHAELEASHARLRRLEEVSCGLGSNLDLDAVLGSIGTTPLDVFGASCLWVLTLDHENNCLEHRWLMGRPQERAAVLQGLFGADQDEGGLAISGQESLLGRVVRSGGAVYLRELGAMPLSEQRRLFGAGSGGSNGLQSVAVVPLVAEEGSVGLLVIGKDAEIGFTLEEQAAAQVLARHIAMAARNSSLFQQVKHHSERDSLTGLYNHRVLFELLEREIELALDAQAQFSLLAVDLDGFKLFNDTYGHPAGDALLQQVASIFSRKTRGSDIVGRSGGDEFMLILPDTDAAGGARVAEHLRSIVAAKPYFAADGLAVPVRMSIGVASYPENGLEAKVLTGYADARLYESKRRGGNTVTSCEDPQISSRQRHGAFGVLDGLVTAVDNKDGYTRAHSDEVATYAEAIAQALKLPKETRVTLNMAALLHDVGKIGVPDHILRKPARLTREETEIVEQHALLGAMILQQLPHLDEIRSGVGSHHERFDGNGYPHGLCGKDIPLLGRILAVADSFSAMTTNRPYRAAFTVEEATREVEKEMGAQFDPEVARAFLSLDPGARWGTPTHFAERR